jgi:Pyruvate/2-oxoacid:ferredoxin oxidoreductase delta subunit
MPRGRVRETRIRESDGATLYRCSKCERYLTVGAYGTRSAKRGRVPVSRCKGCEIECRRTFHSCRSKDWTCSDPERRKRAVESAKANAPIVPKWEDIPEE